MERKNEFSGIACLMILLIVSRFITGCKRMKWDRVRLGEEGDDTHYIILGGIT